MRSDFPSLYAFGRLLYGSAASILFGEEGVGVSEVFNSVGSRQGCSWGSFFYALSIHPYLVQLADEFPDLLIVAYCDDVHIVGPPARAVQAYLRWEHLYVHEIQGELRHSKGKCFAPNSSAEELRDAGLPSNMPIVHDGLRILGAPVGSATFMRGFAAARVAEIAEDFDVLARMPSLQLQHCLVSGALQHRLNHLLRNIPGGDLHVFGDLRTKYDEDLLSVVRRLTGLPQLSSLSRQLAALPLRHGGLGYRTWSNTADCAFLASYVRTSFIFPTMFPTLATHYPSVLSLTDARSAQAASGPALNAFLALTRLAADAPSVYEVLRDDGSKPLRHLQHALSTVHDDAAHIRIVESIIRQDDYRHPRHLALHNSLCGDPTTWGLVPNDPATTFSNRVTEVAIRRRLLLPLQPNTGSERRQCLSCLHFSDEVIAHGGASQVDVYGDHAIRCHRGLKERTSRWHDPLVRQFYSLARMVSAPCAMEVRDLIPESNARPDLVLYSIDNAAPDVLTDVRTSDVTGLKECISAAGTAGTAADKAELDKNSKWLPLTRPLNFEFIPLVVESGGRIGDAALNFINRLSYLAGASPSDRTAFTTYAQQRIRALTVKGTAEVILARLPSRDSPCGAAPRDSVPLAASMPRGASRPPSRYQGTPPQASLPVWLRAIQGSFRDSSTRVSAHISNTIPAIPTTSPEA